MSRFEFEKNADRVIDELARKMGVPRNRVLTIGIGLLKFMSDMSEGVYTPHQKISMGNSDFYVKYLTSDVVDVGEAGEIEAIETTL